MNVVFFGATKGMGRAVARLMAARGDKLFLLGRDGEDLQRSLADLEIRGGQQNTADDQRAKRLAVCDLADRSTFAPALEKAQQALGRIDTVIVSAAVLSPQEKLETDEGSLARLLDINFTNTILFCEQARRILLTQGGGTLCVFSSVAGERARKPVVLYGATKAGLSFYLEGLDHRYRQKGLVTVNVKPGFVKTSMTEGFPVPPFASEPDQVARRILKAIDQGRPVVYAPAIWSAIMGVFRLLPRFMMRRLEV